ILEGRAIDVFNHGEMKRDFTYIDDIVEGVVRVLDQPAEANAEWQGARPDPGSSRAPWRIYNIGNSNAVGLMDFIEALEDALGIKAKKNFLPMQPGDVPATWANVDDLAQAVGYRPSMSVQEGVGHFVNWYKGYYQTPE
ncbi:MAG: NAD-dependent epimerase/dehydratase family protein, partial [Mariprofundus sp.]|nr:NAD-dependent epimerase/dehydratase family protein [Mariprofundus sp.]